MASKLILKFKDNVLGEYPLEREILAIGRKPDNDIHVDNLAVSSRHARVVLKGGAALVEDLGSTNGTFVNGKRVKRQVLKHGDIIRIGKHSLTFVSSDAIRGDETGARGPADLDKTMILKVPAAERTAAHMPLAEVQFLTGGEQGRRVELAHALTSIGKGSDCRIRVKGLTVGKQAAAIARRPSGYHITFLGGLAKLKVNGVFIGDAPHILREGDVIEIGDTKMEFFLKET